MDFPHLDDTKFPLINNVNVYAYKNDFDYTRWIANTKVKLTNVLWNSEYRDVVKFEDNIARDRWFDEHEDYYEVTLKDKHSIPPEGGIKLPIPYDVAVRYNYMVVDVPVMTSADNPIEYEDLESGIRRWYFFVDEVSSRAPNTTMFDISLDVWTQFHNDVEINYLFLERGHAPVAATDVDLYLANPIENNDYLLTPDVTPTSANIVRKSTYIPFGNGEKWVCIATTLNAGMLSAIGTITKNDPDYTYGNISYYDEDIRYGWQLGVNGYGVGNGENWSNLRLDSAGTSADSSKYRIQNNVNVFALPASEVNGSGWGTGAFFYDVMQTCPNLMNAILGVFVVDRAMLDIDSSYVTVATHRLYACHGGTEQTSNLPQLTVEDFDFPERYQRFAKLYTYPYSMIQLTDNEGETVDVRIENTGAVAAHRITQLAFPYINMRMFFTGINGIGSQTYEWRLLNGSSSTAQIDNGDWFDCCFDHEIPCYALYMDGESAWYLDNFNKRIRAGRKNALVAYHNSVRPTNTTAQNAYDYDSYAYANVDADAGTLVTNTNNIANNNTLNTNLTIATNSLLASLAQNSGTLIKDSNNAKANTMRTAANTFTSQSTLAENDQSTATAMFGAGSSIAGAVMSTAVGTAIAGGVAGSAVPGAGNLAGAAAGMAVGSMIGLSNVVASAANSNNAAIAAANINSATASAQIASNDTNYNATERNNDDVQSYLNIDIHNKNTNNNALLRDHTANNNATNRANADNTAITMRANGDRTRRVNDANANYTRVAIVNNAKETLENSRDNMQYDLYDAANAPARSIANYGGNPTADYMCTRGVQIKVRTMPNAEVRQVGDWFARYGYALDQSWDVNESGLCPMKHFCYWKCRDIWIDDRKSSNNAAIVLMSTMFERGVTIWKNPEEVGRVSIYDN